jgi:hypothetical protein
MSAERESDRERQRLQTVGQPIVEKVRRRTNDNTGFFENFDDEDLFVPIYLTERNTAVPDVILDEPLADVRAIYAQVFGCIREELAERLGWEESVWVHVDACLDDATNVVVCTDETVLLRHASKPWRFWWTDELSMAEDLGRWYEAAAARLLSERRRRQPYGTTRA